MDNIPLLYSDNSFLAVNKPAGLLTIPGGYSQEEPDLKALLETEYGRLWTVHRLDRDTSGVVLFARSAAAHKLLNRQFENHQVAKTYHLIACGILPAPDFLADEPLRVDGDRRHRTVIDPAHGKPASTTFRLLQTFRPEVHWVAAFPHSGYTHQIRAHLSYHGCWLLNDLLYAPWPGHHAELLNRRPFLSPQMKDLAGHLPMRRTALHAFSVELLHPINSTPVRIQAPYFQDFQSTIDSLEESIPG